MTKWRRSSRSGPTGNCVELRDDLTALRDSKRPETRLPVDRAALTRLVTFARSR
ncbi:DUF397 domain-containing protein [Actinophytocola sediminis]